jgi:hypothetical protein
MVDLLNWFFGEFIANTKDISLAESYLDSRAINVNFERADVSLIHLKENSYSYFTLDIFLAEIMISLLPNFLGFEIRYLRRSELINNVPCLSDVPDIIEHDLINGQLNVHKQVLNYLVSNDCNLPDLAHAKKIVGILNNIYHGGR